MRETAKLFPILSNLRTLIGETFILKPAEGRITQLGLPASARKWCSSQSGVYRAVLIVSLGSILVFAALGGGSSGIKPASAVVSTVPAFTVIGQQTCIAPWGRFAGVTCVVSPGVLVQFQSGFALDRGALVVGRGSGVEVDGNGPGGSTSRVKAGATVRVSDGAFTINNAGTVVMNNGTIWMGKPFTYLTIGAGAELRTGQNSKIYVQQYATASVSGVLNNSGDFYIYTTAFVEVLGGGTFKNQVSGTIWMYGGALQIQHGGQLINRGFFPAARFASIYDMGAFAQVGIMHATTSSLSVTAGGLFTLGGGAELDMHSSQLFIDSASTVVGVAGPPPSKIEADGSWMITNQQGGCIGGVVPAAGNNLGFTPAASQC
jgi:hypothetical protein